MSIETGPELRTRDELSELARPAFDRIAEYLAAGYWVQALAMLPEARREHEWAHDGFLNAVARVKSSVLEDLGQDAFERIGREMPREGLREFARVWRELDARAAVEAAAAGWHWHMTKFRLLEDETKVTFLLEPCGSGGRLINGGAYYRTSERPLALVANPSGSTFGEPDFPVYCAHCSELTGFNLAEGVSTWLVEGWTKAHRYGACRQYAFKVPSAVPQDFFVRTGIERPGESGVTSEEMLDRIFTDAELAELATHPVDRLERAILAQDLSGSSRLVEECRFGWGVMQHDPYRDWLSGWYDLVLRYHGIDAFKITMRKSAWELFGPIIRDSVGAIQEARLNAWAVYWRSHAAVRAVEQTAGGWRFSVDPGRMLNKTVARAWPDSWLEVFCTAVGLGLEEVDLTPEFGSLKVKGQLLIHDLPLGS